MDKKVISKFQEALHRLEEAKQRIIKTQIISDQELELRILELLIKEQVRNEDSPDSTSKIR